MDILKLEELALNAWPAIKTAVYRGCILRSSNGYTNRANSANPLYTRPEDTERIIDYAEGFYANQNQPAVFKILENPRYAKLESSLSSCGYAEVTPTKVMKADLDNFPEPGEFGVAIENRFTEDWFSAFSTMNNIPETYSDTAKHMLGLITSSVLVASIRQEELIVACGYGALEREYVGFFDIVVSPGHRGKGFARRLMNGIIQEAKNRGATRGYLQVAEANTVARNLYQSLGFDETYSYWYRKKELSVTK